MIWQILAVGVGGSFGALARFGLTIWVERFLRLSAPWPTFTVNMVGCLLFGILYQLTAEKGLLSPDYRPFLLTGFLGAMTTFSTFKHDNFLLFNGGEWILAGVNIFLQVALGLFFIWLGGRGAMLLSPVQANG